MSYRSYPVLSGSEAYDHPKGQASPKKGGSGSEPGPRKVGNRDLCSSTTLEVSYLSAWPAGKDY
jgi:hypothetical protein